MEIILYPNPQHQKTFSRVTFDLDSRHRMSEVAGEIDFRNMAGQTILPPEIQVRLEQYKKLANPNKSPWLTMPYTHLCFTIGLINGYCRDLRFIKNYVRTEHDLNDLTLPVSIVDHYMGTLDRLDNAETLVGQMTKERELAIERYVGLAARKGWTELV